MFPSHGLIARLGERVNTYMYIIPLTILHIRLLHYLSELALDSGVIRGGGGGGGGGGGLRGLGHPPPSQE